MATATELMVDSEHVAVDPSPADGLTNGVAQGVDILSYATSLAPEVTDYKFEHGRRYHAYKEGSYVFPNDEQECDRLDMVHKMHQVAMYGKLYYAPLSQPKRILDLGTGTGIWAIEMADKFPETEVLGNDLSPIQPRWAPQNLRFEVDDVEAEWAFSGKFDFVHGCTLGGSIRDWPHLIKQCFDNTLPGGYCEFTEYDMTVHSPDETVPDDSVLRKTNTKFIQALRTQGIEPCPGPLLENLLKDAGFENVKATKIPLPIGTWPSERRLKEVGAWNFLQIVENVDAFVTYLFSKQLSYSRAEIERLCGDLRAQIQDPKIHAMVYMYNVYGKVPANKGKSAARAS